MAEAEHGLKFTISAIDKAISPIRDLAKTVDSTVKPVRALGKELKKALQVTGIPKLTASIKGVGKELKGAADAATGLLGKLGLFGGGLAGAGLALFKTQLLDVATGNQHLALELQRVTGTAKGAQDALAWINTFAAQTGRPVNELTAAFVALKKEGLNPQAKAMQQVADMAGATGASIEEAAKAVVDARKGQSDALAELLGAKKISRGNYDVFEFTQADGSIKRLAALRDKAADMQKLIDRAFELKGFEGGATRAANSWDGLIQKLLNFKERMAGLIMDSGVFDLLQTKLQGVVAWFDELEKTGELKALAQEWAAALCDGIENIIKGAKRLWDWIQADFIPGFESVKDFMGGWENMAIGLGAVLAGPLIAALASLASAVVSLGMTIMATPIGWIMAAIAAVAAGVYLIIKNWGKIKGFFSGIWASVKSTFTGAWNSVTGEIQAVWNGITGYFSGKFKAITAAFDEGVIQGILAVLQEFHPVTLIAEGVNAISEYLFGVNLFDAGARLVNSIWDGIKGVWADLKAWVFKSWEELTGWLPDRVKSWLGIGSGNTPSQDDKPGGGSQPQPGGQPAPGGTSTGAAAVMDKAGPSGLAGSAARGTEQTVRTEVVIKAENMPQGMTVQADRKQADKTSINCGYAMAGA